jgi:acetyltransferase-like isoleucine patch superfamily enzyme
MRLISLRERVRQHLGTSPTLRTVHRRSRTTWNDLRARRFGFAVLGSEVSVERGCRVQGAGGMAIGRQVTVQRSCWLIVPGWTRSDSGPPRLVIDDGCDLGESCTVSAATQVHIHRNVLVGPRVWITDNNHLYEDVSLPILSQGWSRGGYVHIGENCWLGTGAVIIGARGLTIGRGCVVGANAVVTMSVPDHCVVVGNPARIVRRYDATSNRWLRFDGP